MTSLRTLALRLAPLAAALALSGCISLGPKYQRPEVAMPANYHEPAPGEHLGAVEGSVPDKWWTAFGDSKIDALVDEALAANQDLAVAAARVEEARALYGESRSDRYPVVTAGLSGSRDKLSAETSQLPPGFPLEMRRADATANLSYEFDFWGRLARTSEAARAEMLASEEGRLNVRLGLAADVVTAYFAVAGADAISFHEPAEGSDVRTL
jgi:multidrug efflux system outer membrane protein